MMKLEHCIRSMLGHENSDLSIESILPQSKGSHAKLGFKICYLMNLIYTHYEIQGSKALIHTRAIRVFWHFLHKIEYWVTLGRPLERLNMSTRDPSCTLIFFKMNTPNPNKTNKWAIKTAKCIYL